MSLFYIKIGEPLTKASKVSTISRRLGSLKLFSLEPFPWIHFTVPIFKSSFNFLGAIMKYQKYSESEALRKFGEFLHYPKDRIARLKMDDRVINSLPK